VVLGDVAEVESDGDIFDNEIHCETAFAGVMCVVGGRVIVLDGVVTGILWNTW
jgi:hypothetical protein